MRLLLPVILLLPAQESKLPVPSIPEQKRAEADVRSVYKEDFAKKDRETKRALTQKLLDQAMDRANTATARYVLLMLARDVAAEGMDLTAGFSAVERMDKLYEMGRPPISGATYTSNLNAQKAAFLALARKHASTPDDLAILSRAYLELAEAALAALEFDDAQAAADQAARLSRDGDLTSRVSALSKEIPLRRQEEAAAKKAELALSVSADDAEANLTMGRYLLFVKGDDANGLASLLKCGDPGLQDAARKELSKPSSPEAMAEVAEAWAALASKERSPLHKRRYQERGLRWFKLAHERAGGLTKAKIERRLRELDPAGLAGRTITFTSPDRLNLFVTSGGAWKIQAGELVGCCPGGTEWATVKASYSAITQIRVRGRIVPPARTNFRIWAGPLRIIFNWELAEENHYWNYWNGRVRTVTKPPLMTPGRESEIVILQTGKKVTISVDGKKDYETEAILNGTVSFQASLGSTIAIRELRIDGTIDPAKEVAAENRAEP